MIDDEAHRQLLTQLWTRLGALAAANGAEVRAEDDAAGWYRPGTTFVLEPHAPSATQIAVFPEDAWTTWVEFGRAARVEVATEPEEPARAVDEVMAVVGAIVAGRARQRTWYPRGSSEPIGWEAWVEAADGSRWLQCRPHGRVPGRLARWRYQARDVRYAPFR